MKEVTLKIPDKKLEFFLELVKELGFEIAKEVEIPEWQKEVVRERINSAVAEDAVSWHEARQKFTFKDKP